MKALAQLTLVISISFVIVLIVTVLLIVSGKLALDKIGEQILTALGFTTKP